MTENGSHRRPGTLARVVLLVSAVAFAAVLLTGGFPPGAPDRLPVLAVAVLLAVLGAAWPARAIALFAFLFPCAGLLARICGGSEPVTWPGVLFAGLLAGWCFRFLYDFESRPEPTRPDRPLGALFAVWVLATLVAAGRAVTLWAAVRRMSGRAVNGDGLSDATALKETLFAFTALAGGAAFYFLLRRAGEHARRLAVSGALAGAGVSAAAAVLQRAGILPGEAGPYWSAVGRLSGGAVDPNSLGMTCALLLLVAFSRALAPGRRRAAALLLFLLLASGLVLSGSRSGFVVAGIGLVLLLAAPALPARARVSAAVALAVVGGAAALAAFVSGGGNVGARIAQTFDPRLSAEYRLSARPLLWRAAGRLFLESPVAGGGMGAFTWRFPDLLAAESRTLPTRDNPGSGYVQALAETGAVGFLVTAAALLALASQAFRRLRVSEGDPDGPAAGAAAIAFVAALMTGSHWLAPDVCLLFFLLAARCAPAPDPALPAPTNRRRGRWGSTALGLAVAVYAVAAAVALLGTAQPCETFRYSPRIGFHELERGPGGSFRWTRQRFAVWVRPGDPPLRLGLANFGPAGAPMAFEARAGGRVFVSRSLRPGEATAVVVAPGRAPGAVTFRLDRSFVPRRLGVSPDRRRLGLLSTSSADGALPASSAAR